MEIKVSNIKVKVPAKVLPMLVECPSCGHRSEMLAKQDIDVSASQGTGEGPCHKCGALLVFDWSR